MTTTRSHAPISEIAPSNLDHIKTFTRLKGLTITVFGLYLALLFTSGTPIIGTVVGAAWFVLIVALTVYTGKSFKALLEVGVKRRSVRIPRIFWRVAAFVFGSTSLLLFFRPLGYTSGDIMLEAARLLSPIVLTAIAMRVIYLENSYPSALTQPLNED